jgi:phospholipid/cholesterol/gamma-HCH transport system ATP-binding protein
MTLNPTASEKIALSVKNLHKSFGEKQVHRGVSFDLRENEILGLFGGSGTGKSVILRSIIGLETPDAGEILFEGRDLLQLSERELFPVRTKISYVFQNGALFDSLTVEENLAYPLQAHTKLSDEETLKRVNETLELIDMKDSNHLLPNELSGGMQKRAGFARFKKRGMTGLFVTHDIPAAFEICDRIAILNQGKIDRLMTVEEMKHSDDPLVKSFTTGAQTL